MREHGQRGTERAIQQDLLGRVRNMIRTANYVGNSHVDVVDYHAHLVHRLAELLAFTSRAQQHEVFDLVVREFPFTENGVFKSRRAAKRYLETDGRLPIRG